MASEPMDGELRIGCSERVFQVGQSPPRQLGALFILAEGGVSLRQAGGGESQRGVVRTDEGFLERERLLVVLDRFFVFADRRQSMPHG